MMGEPIESPADRQASRATEMPAIAVIWMIMVALRGSDDTYIHSKPVAAIYFTALWAPLAIVGFIAMGRKFFSFHRPARWPEGSPVLARAKVLLVGMAGLGFLFAVWSTIAGHLIGRHDPRYSLPQDGLWFLIGWIWVLTAYMAERKPLPPPRRLEANWDGMKPIRSEHWGQPAPQSYPE
jgi:hypothetical protein